jgi:hypothetical protein
VVLTLLIESRACCLRWSAFAAPFDTADVTCDSGQVTLPMQPVPPPGACLTRVFIE